METNKKIKLLIELLEDFNGRHSNYINVWKSNAIVLLTDIFGSTHASVIEIKNIKTSDNIFFRASKNHYASLAAVNVVKGCIKLLELQLKSHKAAISLPRVFISYATCNKALAGNIKNFLKDRYQIPVFLAHEDINISIEWRNAILNELINANVFIAILDKNFRFSDWCSQELGIAVSK